MATAKSTQDKAQQNAATDVAVPVVHFTTQELADIETFDDALRLLADTIGTEALATADATLGDGFAVIDSKDRLIGVPFVLLNWQTSQGDHGAFTVARGMTRDGFKFVLTDGSTGIHEQLLAYTGSTGSTAGLLCRHGLRRSDYTYDDNGKDKEASTYYIDTSA